MGDDPIGLVIVSILLIPLLAIVALVLGEVLLLLLLLPFFVLSRSVFGTPWVIEVWQGHKILHFEAVEGWGESSQRIERLATQVREGHLPLGNRPRDDLRRDDLPQDHPPQDDLAQGHLPQDNPSQGGKGQPTFQDMLREDRPS